MAIYKPASLAIPPPLIVAMHYCTGTAEAYFEGITLASLADQHGFIVLYPTAPAVGTCWDVNHQWSAHPQWCWRLPGYYQHGTPSHRTLGSGPTTRFCNGDIIWRDDDQRGYRGPRPKVQFWHGTITPELLEEIKQWTNVFGVSQTPKSNVTGGDLEAGYSRASLGPHIQAILAQGVGHTVPEHETDTLEWFGLS